MPLGEEPAPGPGEHQRRQHALRPPRNLAPDRRVDQARHPGDDVRPHLQREDRQRQSRRPGQPAAEVRRRVVMAMHRIGSGGLMRGRLVARIGRHMREPRRGRGSGQERHRRAPGGKVRLRVQDPRHGRERTLDPTCAGGAGHAGHVQHGRLDACRVARAVERGRDGGRRSRSLDRRPTGCQIDGSRRHAGDPRQRPFSSTDAGGAGQAIYLECQGGHRRPRVCSRPKVGVPAGGRSRAGAELFSIP